MSYSTVSNVIDTWEKIRRIKDYEKLVGSQLFQRFFAEEPQAKVIFGMSESMDTNSDEILKNPRFVKHAVYFIQMIDRALGMLGPNTEILTEIMLDLGEKHVRYGVKPEYFASMGRALIHAVASNLDKENFTEEIKADWHEGYGALSYDMIRGQRRLSAK